MFPTDDEIEAYGCSNAGEYLARLRADNEERYQAFLHDPNRNPQWGDEPFQPVGRCVAHICAILLRRIVEASGGAGSNSLEISAIEANGWAKKMVSFKA